ncbi:hypothetical protein LUZ60_011650 [Juncus effusus]|nr:hypothetical protein LUZ60_011650 [Juncus effusus]
MAESSSTNPEADGRSEAEGLGRRVDEFVTKTDQLEKNMQKVVNFYQTNRTLKNLPHNELICSKKMQDLMCHFGIILRHIMKHEWAGPFLKPVNVKGLGLDDYYQVIKKPMDLGTIQKRMEAQEYKNVSDICADVRLVFDNAMKYNEIGTDVHKMAQTLSNEFEKKWRHLSPKVAEEEARQEEEERGIIGFAKLAKDTNNELNELNLQLEELRQEVGIRCRKMNTEEKRRLGTGLSKLNADDLNKVLEIIAKENPNFHFSNEEVDLDMDAQSEITLWRLYFFVKEALEKQAKDCGSIKSGDFLKRKREKFDVVSNIKKQNKKLSI